MRRPVIFLFLSFTFGIALEYHLDRSPFHFLIFGGILAAALLSRQREAQGLLSRQREALGLTFLFLLAALLGSVYFYLAEHHMDPLEQVVGKTCAAEGRVVTVHRKDENYWQMLITSEGAGKRLVQVKGAMGDPAEYVGKWATVRGEVTLPSERRNPGLFDYRLYLKTKGVRVILQSNAGQIHFEPKNSYLFFTLTARLKYGFLDRLEKEMAPEAFGLMNGMLFGDVSFIGDDVYESFQKNGIAHILSVSGIHAGIVYLFIGRLLGNRKTKGFYLFAALILVFYAALSEFSPSVVRAAVMILIHMFSKVTYRRYDFLSCTAASALGMLLVNPFYLFNAGFQLSYLAVFCLAALLPWVSRRIDIMEEKGAGILLAEGLRLFSPLLIIQIGMAPVTAYLFNYFSIASFFINMPVIAISGIIIPLGICLIPLSFLYDTFFGTAMFGTGAMAAELLVNAMLWLNELFFLPGIGFFNTVSPSVFSLLVFYGFFFFLTSEFFRILYQRKRRKVMAVCCCLILILSLPMSLAADTSCRDAALVFVDVGQGDCLHIRTPKGRNILIDGGGSQNYNVGEKILLPYLLKNGVGSVDLAIATHLHEDHFLGIAQLAGKMEVRQFGTYEANRLREGKILADTGLESEDMLYLAAGDRIRIEKDVWIDVLYPEEHPEEEYRKLISDDADENRSSLLLKVYYRGITVMMTGDLGFEGEQEVLGLYEDDAGALDVDVLKVGHHGSRYSTGNAFLGAVNPEAAVFQVGKNNYGHPHSSVIEKCLKNGIIIYRNDLSGAVIFNQRRQWQVTIPD
ncbi:MAG TPA: DNA internalization-related competence protein ComEC/Rec2 [Anaerovoracaceae bacterium]|nr:DNA internalization-related competence protein ComEC/Rec2 [Anaerovoracaceae bacterium]